MSLITVIITAIVIAIAILMRTPKKSHKNQFEIVQAPKVVEVEVVDEMTKEKVRNLFDEQDLYNAKISFLTRQNKQYEHEIELLEERYQQNIESMKAQLAIQPNLDMNMLRASYEGSNNNIEKHKLKYEGMILSNMEKIISYKKKSNAISEQITKIGKEIYDQRAK